MQRNSNAFYKQKDSYLQLSLLTRSLHKETNSQVYFQADVCFPLSYALKTFLSRIRRQQKQILAINIH